MKYLDPKMWLSSDRIGNTAFDALANASRTTAATDPNAPLLLFMPSHERTLLVWNNQPSVSSLPLPQLKTTYCSVATPKTHTLTHLHLTYQLLSPLTQHRLIGMNGDLIRKSILPMSSLWSMRSKAIQNQAACGKNISIKFSNPQNSTSNPPHMTNESIVAMMFNGHKVLLLH